MKKKEKKSLDPIPSIFFGVYTVLFLFLTPIFWVHAEIQIGAILVAIALYCIGAGSITLGYHRFFSHKTYNTHPVIEWITLIGSLLAIQGSALEWSSDHRVHHAKTDTDEDPYSIKKGFWYAHIGWIFLEKNRDFSNVPDLTSNPRVMFQHKYYPFLAAGFNTVVFLLFAQVFGFFSSFYLIILFRFFIIHHSTFFINSLAHMWGSRTFAKELTAVDNFFLALLTFGEGYHNYHHAFPNDYRNGVKWYHFDPTKWTIKLLEKVGLASQLRTKDHYNIRKNLVLKDLRIVLETLKEKLADIQSSEKFQKLAAEIQEKIQLIEEKIQEYKELIAQKADKFKIKICKVEIRKLKKEFRVSWESWLRLMEYFEEHYKPQHSH